MSTEIAPTAALKPLSLIHIYGNSYLPEAKLIDVSADTEEKTRPIFELLNPYLLGYDGTFATEARCV